METAYSRLPMKMNTAHSKLDCIYIHHIKAVVFLISRGMLSLYQGKRSSYNEEKRLYIMNRKRSKI